MEILRLLPYGSTTVQVEIPSDDYAGVVLEVTITDLSDLSVLSQYDQNISASATLVSVDLPSLYDADYRVEVKKKGTSELIADEAFELRRPYVNPSKIGTTAGEIAEATKHEEIARAIIDSIVEEGFYYKKKVIETIGNGTDYMPVWDDVKKVLEVYQNNVLVTESEFEVTRDKTAITPKYSGTWDRNESARIIIPAAMSDFPDTSYAMPTGFIYGYDYKFVVEVGYTTVPSDIARAATLLIEDLACGKLDYYKRFVTSYNTDQFRLQFDKQLFDGTGNIIVDKILSKYKKSIKKLGVL